MQTDRHTDTKVNTEDTLSRFQEFFIQPTFHGAQKQTKMVQTVEAIVHRFDLVIAPESDSCGFCGRVKQIS